MAEKKSLFSVFFSGSDAKRGARDGSDGSKGLNELKSENNVDMAQNLKQAKDIPLKESSETVIQDNTKQRQKKHSRLHVRSPYDRRPRNTSFKKLNKRYNEVKDEKNVLIKEGKGVQKNISKKLKNKDKVIADFIKRFDPSFQQEIKDMMEKTVQQKAASVKQNAERKGVLKATPAVLPSAEKKETTDIREKIEQKRGLYRQTRRERMLKAAKELAEKARMVVKNLRLKVTGQLPKVAKQKDIPQKTQKQQNQIVQRQIERGSKHR